MAILYEPLRAIQKRAHRMWPVTTTWQRAFYPRKAYILECIQDHPELHPDDDVNNVARLLADTAIYDIDDILTCERGGGVHRIGAVNMEYHVSLPRVQ